MTSTIPSASLGQHIAVLGKTGSGKSYAIRGVVERLLDDKARACIIDPTGTWWGLKSSSTGKSAGYPVVIFGGTRLIHRARDVLVRLADAAIVFDRSIGEADAGSRSPLAPSCRARAC